MSATQPAQIDERKRLLNEIIDIHTAILGEPRTVTIEGWTGQSIFELRLTHKAWTKETQARKRAAVEVAKAKQEGLFNVSIE